MWLICGLGNPEKKYNLSRHNLGFEIIDLLVSEYNFELIKKNKSNEIYKGKFQNTICLLCKPLTYMNNSGVPINELMNFYKVSNSKIIIIHDDLDLKVGKIKLKFGGGNGGHNGLLSIDNNIGKDYKRVRIGIGRPSSRDLVSKYVLKKFNKDDRIIINKKINLLVKYFDLIFDNDSLLLTKRVG